MRLSSVANKVLRPAGLELRRVPHPVPAAAPAPAAEGDEKGARETKRFKRSLHFRHLVGLIDDVRGAIVECGVGAGKSMFLLATMTEGGRHPRTLWGFDSFQGLPAATPEDEAETMTRKLRAGKFAHSEDDVRAYLVSYGMDEAKVAERIVLVPGYFPDSFEQYDGGPIALLHLDVDLYQSYKDCLEFFEPLVVPGGVVAFDEYRSPQWPGAAKSIDEYYGGPPPGAQTSPHWNRWFLVK
ncbi:MAG TPA: TylF/MycF/NovP-related O-methyltransferase [Gaiellaceae bacterium]|nr:TylF/MycF/NovP-related O-methyltransferase [Gaiellaceae bacterium]